MPDEYLQDKPRRGSRKRKANTVAVLDHAVRLRGVGASEVAAIMGKNSWGRTGLSTFLEKTGRVPRDPPSPRTRWGLKLEQEIIAEFELLTGKRTAGDGRTTYQHGEHPWALATPDRFIVGSRELLECKTTGYEYRDNWGRQGTDEIPLEYKLQCQWQMFVTGTTRVHVAVLIGGNDFRIYTVDRRDDVIAACVRQVRLFVECLETDTPPPPHPEYDTDELELLARYGARVFPGVVEATPDDEKLLTLYGETRLVRDGLTREIERMRAAIEARIGQRDVLHSHLYNANITNKQSGDVRKIDWQQIVRDCQEVIPPEVIERNTTTVPGSRRFTPTSLIRSLERSVREPEGSVARLREHATELSAEVDRYVILARAHADDSRAEAEELERLEREALAEQEAQTQEQT